MITAVSMGVKCFQDTTLKDPLPTMRLLKKEAKNMLNTSLIAHIFTSLRLCAIWARERPQKHSFALLNNPPPFLLPFNLLIVPVARKFIYGVDFIFFNRYQFYEF
eukprot:TRINITY_DN51887_c0_g1_i1.p1 TRINITY_DN51887_c0_g1~~TRINITY_DN51887_c0_g1_i1.p1  ORF type:complete len:105 (-),score=2.08 TRINITY_DN51887_c0_g1_i1:307-621(-)